MEVKNNPAGRLFDILDSARRQNGKESARKAWASVFEIDPSDTSALLQMLAELINLAGETKASIQKLDDVDHELHLKPFTKIEALLSRISLDSNWDNWKNQLDEVTLYGLQFSADKLSRRSGFSKLPEDEINSIRAAADDLFNVVSDSDLPVELKALLLRNLESIRRAFATFKLQGIDGIHNEIERSFGSILLHRDAIKASKVEDQEIWEAFFNLVDRLNKLVALARNSTVLAAPAIQALARVLS